MLMLLGPHNYSNNNYYKKKGCKWLKVINEAFKWSDGGRRRRKKKKKMKQPLEQARDVKAAETTLKNPAIMSCLLLKGILYADLTKRLGLELLSACSSWQSMIYKTSLKDLDRTYTRAAKDSLLASFTFPVSSLKYFPEVSISLTRYNIRSGMEVSSPVLLFLSYTYLRTICSP